MSHNARILPDAAYQNGRPIGAIYYQALDTAQSKAINALTGGTWMPTTPIVIGGAGVAFCGPTTLAGGATITTPPGSGKRIVHGANDVPVLPVGHILGQRVFLTEIASVARTTGGMSPGFAIPEGGTPRVAGFTSFPGKRVIVPMRVHHGAHIAAIEVRFTPAPHLNLPDHMPQMRAYSVDVFGVIRPLQTNPKYVNPNSGGYISAVKPATAAAYSGVRVMSYAPDPTNVVDAVNFGYMVEILDETGIGAVAGNQFQTLYVYCTGINSMGFQ